MAGDWIKMRTNLDTDPAVVRIASGLNLDRMSVVGRLHKIWAWANEHSVDGQEVPIDAEFLDSLVATPGFSAQLRNVSWLSGRDGSLSFPNFLRHNGESAKQRALDSERKRKSRKVSAICPDDNRTKIGPEKRREEKSINTNRINTDSSAVGLPTTEPNSDDFTLLVFPCVGSPNHWNLTKSMVQKWQALYPTVDVMDECRRALAWCDANTNCRKTSRGMPKFFVGWLNRASDSKSRKTAAPPNQYLTKIQQQEANMAAVLERAMAADLAQENGEEFSFFRLTSQTNTK